MDSEIIDISNFSEDLNPSWGNHSGSGSSSTSFGSGIELLMNDKKRESTNNSHHAANDINIDDLNNLESELNNLADDSSSIRFEPKSSLFGNNNNNSNDNDSSRFNVQFNDDTSLGKSTSESGNINQTWDGYGKFNNVPLNPDKPISQQPHMSKEEMLREKFKYLRKLEALETKGVSLTKKYSMESPLAEMQGEYEMIMEEKSKQNSVKFQGNMLMACVNGLEFLNGRFDPFDIKLDGWSDQINENLGDYDEIFGELHEKYKSKATLAPELKILFQLGGSAMMVHMTNTMFKSAMPGVDDILRQNPDLMRQFQSAAVNSMGQSNPGLSGFMNGMMNNESHQSHQPPPPPMETQSFRAPEHRMGNNTSASSSSSSRASSVFTSGNYRDDGINIRENFGNSNSEQSKRPEMKGPSDINDILSKLKTKTINIKEPTNNHNHMDGTGGQNTNDNSMISIADMKELQGDGNIPKRSKRRQKSDKNTLSLDM